MDRFAVGAVKAPAITCIGGGTGLSTMLRGLKHFTPNITAIVTVTDDGGGSGVLRDELGMPPPGDIRNCIQALSNMEPTMEKLMAYRFESGHLEGQNFGNLFLAAMNGISDSFDEAVARMGEVLAITGRVLPVTNSDIRLLAEFEDGSEVLGETRIVEAKRRKNCRIRRMQLVPAPVRALPESVDAIMESDMIILGPGSLYTSIIPNLLVDGISEAIAASDAVKLYISNIMTQPGETECYTVSDHVRELFSHSGARLFDMCLVNSLPAPPELLERYYAQGAGQIDVDEDALRKLGVEVIKAPIAGQDRERVRHNPWLLADEIIRIFREKSPTRLYGERKD